MLAQFSIRLICGMSLMLVLMPRKGVAAGFFRVQTLILLGLSVLAFLASGPNPPNAAFGSVTCLAMAGVAFFGSVLWTLEQRQAGGFALGLIAMMSTGWLVSSAVASPTAGLGSYWGVLNALGALSSAAVLGGAMTAMLLGHSYLTAPTMSIAPLSRLNAYLGCAALVRGILSAAVLALAPREIAGMTYLLWLTLRWLAGILGPCGVFVMVRRILRYRNTQAATGVLFVGVILTFIGELTADLLFHDLHLPL